jgi:flagellar hook assembly protein FlgD
MRVQISIFDASGRCVRRLLDRVESAGSHVVDWDGRDEEGSSLGSGMYVCHLGTAAGNISRKMILLK